MEVGYKQRGSKHLILSDFGMPFKTQMRWAKWDKQREFEEKPPHKTNTKTISSVLGLG